VVIRDRRRIDPETGDVRNSGGSPFAAATAPGDPAQASQPLNLTVDGEEAAKLRAELAERTADLQRVTAEYANYRKRVLRDQDALVSNAKGSVAAELLPVLDDLELARKHGDLVGSFKSVADRLVGILEKLGLQGYGVEGEEFDPAHHEAVHFATSADVAAPTVSSVFRRGYSFKDRPLRVAVVAVTGPHHDEPNEQETSVTTPDTGDAAAADQEDLKADAEMRSEQESKQPTAPDLGAASSTAGGGGKKPAGNPPPAEDPA
jgi:molecular chaperone GrpE